MTSAPQFIRRLATPLLLLFLCANAGGCFLLGGNPDKVNIQLRKDKQVQAERIAALEAKVKADAEVIAGLQNARPTVPTLPAERLARLFTTHGLRFERLTGGWDRDRDTPGHEGVVVYVAPVDDDGQPIKAAGAFVVEAFDLAAPSERRIGRWAFDVPAAKATWRGSLMNYNYVLQCPWPNGPPAHGELTLKVTFVDELTQTPFTAQTVITVEPPTATTRPAATAPAGTKPATRPAMTTTRPAG